MNLVASCLFFSLLLVVVGARNKVGKFTPNRPGKTITKTDNGDVDITISRKKFADDKARLLCCPFVSHHCKGPCRGLACTATCTVTCGFFGLIACPSTTCQVANPGGCTAVPTLTCDAGYTLGAGTTKCYKLETAADDWLAALRTCIAMGGDLAKIENQAEQDAVFAVTGTSTAWIGLSDLAGMPDGTFAWSDGTALGFNNWLAGQPDNAGLGQDCVVIRMQGGSWNDANCNVENPFVCEKPAA
jgi:hypothetical protein